VGHKRQLVRKARHASGEFDQRKIAFFHEPIGTSKAAKRRHREELERSRDIRQRLKTAELLRRGIVRQKLPVVVNSR